MPLSISIGSLLVRETLAELRRREPNLAANRKYSPRTEQRHTSPRLLGFRFVFRDRFLGDTEAVDGDRDARVAADLQQDLRHLLLGDTVAQRCLHMGAQLVRAVQHADEGEVDDAAVAA